MRITSLIENQRNPGDPRLEAEWGLSLCVETDRHRILVDTGASEAFARNAERLSIDVAAIDAAIVSHHHYDHGGGLARFLALNDHAPIYIGEAPDGAPTAKLLGALRKYIGLDTALIARHADRFRVIRETTEVVPGVFVLPRIGGGHPRPSGNKYLYLQKDGTLRPDDFRHELVVALRQREGLVVLTGCSHNGLVNMVETVCREFPGAPVRAVVGGFHFGARPPFGGLSETEQTVTEVGCSVLRLGVETTYTGHCTGQRALELLREAMGDRVRELRTGTRIEFTD